MTLTTNSFSFIHNPSNVGFDRWIDVPNLLTNELAKNVSYPPHNLIKIGPLDYIVEIAVAGYKQSDIEITQEKSSLVVKGEIKDKDQNVEYLHRGLSRRNFTKAFTLADTVVVKSASLEDGILKISLKNEIPERDLPRKIEIQTGQTKTEPQFLVD